MLRPYQTTRPQLRATDTALLARTPSGRRTFFHNVFWNPSFQQLDSKISGLCFLCTQSQCVACNPRSLSGPRPLPIPTRPCGDTALKRAAGRCEGHTVTAWADIVASLKVHRVLQQTSGAHFCSRSPLGMSKHVRGEAI
jgi:hypothetical protein